MIYQSIFRQPKGHLNKLDLKMSDLDFPIEVFPTNKGQTRWRARHAGSDKPGSLILWIDGSPITHPGSSEVKTIIEGLFEARVTPWRAIPHTEEELKKAAEAERPNVTPITEGIRRA